jgi:hypothetical protein
VRIRSIAVSRKSIPVVESIRYNDCSLNSIVYSNMKRLSFSKNVANRIRGDQKPKIGEANT